MKKSSILRTLLVSSVMFSTFPAMAGNDVESIVKDGNFFGEVRYRYENVEQDGISNNANASTIRTNVGFKTGEYKSFQALIEGQLVNNIGFNEYNSTTNGETTYPVVADPNVAEINELWVTYSGVKDTVFKVGRQKVNLDNKRYIGTVNWRQNDQTYDAAAIINSSIPNLNLLYAYVSNVNTINGGKHALGDLDTKTHLMHANYKVADWLDITGYGYLWDVKLAPSLSAKTFGVRATGSVPINDDWSFFYEAEVAKQSDYGDNTSNYDEAYYHIAPGIKGHGFTLKLGYEELGGNGTTSFITPLATGHEFNGWADKFLSTPTRGLQDAYVSGSYKASGTSSMLDGTKFTAVYHKFDGDSSGDFGSEIDMAVGRKFTLPDSGQPFKDVDVLLKFADYNADDTAYTDTQKIWVQFGVKF